MDQKISANQTTEKLSSQERDAGSVPATRTSFNELKYPSLTDQQKPDGIPLGYSSFKKIQQRIDDVAKDMVSIVTARDDFDLKFIYAADYAETVNDLSDKGWNAVIRKVTPLVDSEQLQAVKDAIKISKYIRE